jgi:hypothetical protein
MNISLIPVIDWLQYGNHFLVILGVIISLLGGCYSAANTLLTRKSLAIGKIMHCVIMGLIGGFAFGITSLFCLPPLFLVLRIYLFKPPLPHSSLWQSLLLALPAIVSPTFWAILVQIMLFGAIIGLGFGIVNVLLELLLPTPRTRPAPSSPSTSVPQLKMYSRVTATAWFIFFIGFSLGFSFVFSNFLLSTGCAFCLAFGAFLLGFHPKPSFTRQPWLKIVRIIGFWLVCGTFFLLAIVKGIVYPLLKSFGLTLFILIVLLLFSALLFWLMKNVKFQKLITAKADDANRARLVLNRVQVRRTLLVGVLGGFLIIGCIFGLPLGYFFWQYFGPAAALFIFLAFALFGIGYGFAWGALLCYSYNFSLFIAWKITNLSNTKLQTIGFILVALGIILAAIPSLS